MDTLTITGQGRRLNGEYECDIAGLIDVTSDNVLTVREAHLVKTLSGARGGEIVEAFLAGDMAVRMAVAVVILQRADRRVDIDSLWDAPAGWARFEFGPEKAEELENPTTDIDPVTTTTESMSATGGQTRSATTAESQDDDRSPTGFLDSDIYAVSTPTT